MDVFEVLYYSVIHRAHFCLKIVSSVGHDYGITKACGSLCAVRPAVCPRVCSATRLVECRNYTA